MSKRRTIEPMPPVAILGAGVARPEDDAFPSHAELLYRATRRALDDAGIKREDITTAVTSSYDYVEGRPLSNQFTLDSIGGTMKPCDLRVGDDGMHALGAGVSAALADPGAVVVVGAVQLRRSEHSPEAFRRIEEISYEPVWGRPIVRGASSAQALAFGMRAQSYLSRHGASEDELAALVSRRSANGNGSRRGAEEILDSTVIAGPLRELHVAPPADVAATLLLRAEPEGASPRGLVRGVGWSAVDALFGDRDLSVDEPTSRAAADAYVRAGITDPASEVDQVEAYNTYGIDELQAVEALGLAPAGGAVDSLLGSSASINPRGGVQAEGWAPGAASLASLAGALDDGDAGAVIAAQGWTGCGGCSAAVAVVERGGRG